jgi:hypothetical protein
MPEDMHEDIAGYVSFLAGKESDEKKSHNAHQIF